MMYLSVATRTVMAWCSWNGSSDICGQVAGSDGADGGEKGFRTGGISNTFLNLIGASVLVAWETVP